MLIPTNEIDAWIENLLGYLVGIQNQNGSFETFYSQPYFQPHKSWMKYPGDVVYTTAQTLVPLLKIKSELSDTLLNKSIPFLISSSLDKRLWTFAPISSDYLIPYDSDSTSLTSLVLESKGIKLSNKDFLNSVVNKHHHYPFYIKKFISFYLPLKTQFKLNWHNFKMRKSKNIKFNIMNFSDFEFGSSCINLLYLGENKKNRKVWNKVEKEFNEFKIETLYYMDLFHSFYFLARLIFYTKNHKIDGKIVNQYIAKLTLELKEKHSVLNQLLLINSIMFLNLELQEISFLIDSTFESILEEGFKQNEPFFSSNKNTDIQPDTHLPNTYFGSPAITCSLYIEFLNLYRFRMYGKYYKKI